jgi:hypothetical protein
MWRVGANALPSIAVYALVLGLPLTPSVVARSSPAPAVAWVAPEAASGNTNTV